MEGQLYLVVERFRDGDPRPVYARFAERGRMTPEGVEYVDSWVTEDLTTCYQVMRAPSHAALDAWIGRWDDLVDFEVLAVLTSSQAAAAVGRLAVVERDPRPARDA